MTCPCSQVRCASASRSCQWNTIRWNIKISEADFESAKLDFTQAVTSALNEVDTVYFSYANAQRSLENTLSKHQKDVRIGEYYQTRYDLGAAELKDYLDALNTADNSMLSALEAKYRVIRYENQIYKAMGGRYERILPPSGGKATQGHTSTNGETHVQVKEINKRRLRTPNGSSKPATPSCAMPWLRNAPWAFMSR